MRLLLALVMVCCVSVGVFAQAPRVDRIDILEQGIYHVETVHTIKNPNLTSGTYTELTNIRNTGVTATIPARLGTWFGVRYRVAGKPEGAAVPITMVMRFPHQGMRNPETRETRYRDEYVVRCIVGTVYYCGFGLGHGWEMIPGIWTFEFWYKGRKLAAQSFTVVRP